MKVKEKNIINKYKNILKNYLRIQLSNVLSLLDRDIHSETYGCLDRQFWHYKSKNFINGMNQSYIYTLALFYKTNFQGNFLFKNEKAKSYLRAAIRFTVNNIHKDGSLDEHYYNEHSIAATAFTLFSITETILLIDLDYGYLTDYFRRSSNFLLKNKEKYIRSNHTACIALCFYNLSLITGEKLYLKYTDQILDLLFNNWSDEGWFREYEGCDPGYNTFTLYYLSKYALKRKDQKMITYIKKSIFFCSHFIHPDLSYGGLYGSRNTMHFFPYSFEFIDMKNNLGKKMVNSFVKSMGSGTAELITDSRFSFFQVDNILEMYNNFIRDRITDYYKGPQESDNFPEAGIYIYVNENYHVILNYKKAGVLYIFKNGKLINRFYSILIRTNHGILKSVGFNHTKYKKIEKGFLIEGYFKKNRKNQTFNHFYSFFLEIFNFTLGQIKIFRKALKNLLIKKLILEEKRSNVSYKIKIKFGKKIRLNYEIRRKNSKINISEIRLSSFFTDIYVPSNKFFQIHNLANRDLILKSCDEREKETYRFNLII